MQNRQAILIAELNQVHELAKKLRENLKPSQIELCRALSREIRFSIDKAVSTAAVLSIRGRDGEQKMPKKRKPPYESIRRVRASIAAGTEVPPDDGYTWRKYGQKEILGAKHQRAYYRCSYCKTHGCSAKKQVQISDENDSVFDITYLGNHTCSNPMQQIVASKTHLYEPQQSLLVEQTNSFLLHIDLQSSAQNPNFPSFPFTPLDGLMKQEDALLNSHTVTGLDEIIPAADSVAESPLMDIAFMLESGDVNTDSTFDDSIFFF